jgi:hypothetical protein
LVSLILIILIFVPALRQLFVCFSEELFEAVSDCIGEDFDVWIVFGVYRVIKLIINSFSELKDVYPKLNWNFFSWITLSPPKHMPT